METVVQSIQRSSLEQLKVPVFNINRAIFGSNARVVMMSDTHCKHDYLFNVPAGDILIHAGDSTDWPTIQEFVKFTSWYGRFPHPIKILIAGNHDYLFHGKKKHQDVDNPFTPDRARQMCANAGILYLQDQELIVDRLKIHGTPWQPAYKDMPFNIKDPADRRKILEKINPVDILVTHAPAKGILDINEAGEHVGCEVIAEQMERINPKLHVFGHVHESHGEVEINGRKHVNASVVDLHWNLVHPAIAYDLKV